MNKLLLPLLGGIIGGLTVFGAGKFFTPTHTINASAEQPVVRQVNYGSTPVPFDFVKAAERTVDAVVHIKVKESAQSARQRGRRSMDPFGFFDSEMFGQPQPRAGSGSGVIYTSDGYIITNNHVIEFADEYEVTLHDNREFKARLVGRDPSTDMAVIKIDATNLPAIEIGSSDNIKIGQWVLAVGNPFDLTSTVTAGIVSAKGRDINIIKSENAIESFLQTDAAVNPGNSGGALVDTDGKLVGINSAIAGPNGTFAGYAFAIPVDLAKKIADDLIKYGEFRRAYLGVDIYEVSASNARELNTNLNQGIYVKNVIEGGSAASSGIQPGDIIVQVNGKNVTSVGELREIIGRYKIGDNVSVVVDREGKQREIAVKLKTRPAN